MNHIPLSDYEHMPICWFTAFEISRRCRHVLLTASPPRHIVEEEPGGRLDENDLSIGKNRRRHIYHKSKWVNLWVAESRQDTSTPFIVYEKIKTLNNNKPTQLL